MLYAGSVKSYDVVLVQSVCIYMTHSLILYCCICTFCLLRNKMSSSKNRIW